jgi:hypothetical protein
VHGGVELEVGGRLAGAGAAAAMVAFFLFFLKGVCAGAGEPPL